MPMDYNSGQASIKAYNSANPIQDTTDYGQPLEYRAGTAQQNDVQSRAMQQYAGWRGAQTSEDLASYDASNVEHYNKGRNMSRLAFLAAAGGIAGLGATLGGTAATAAAEGATSFPVASNYVNFADIIPGTAESGIGAGFGGGGAAATGAPSAASTVATGAVGTPASSIPGGVTPSFTPTASSVMSGLGGWRGAGDLVNAGLSTYGALSNSRQLAALGRGAPSQQTAESQLDALLKDPNSITKMPGYEAGLQAVQRTGAGQGYLGSGNMMIALDKYGGDFYNNTVRQLQGIAQANAGVNAEYTIGGMQLFGDASNQLGNWLSKYGNAISKLIGS
jgi:hypothetical protein